jgi:hypothetical protein
MALKKSKTEKKTTTKKVDKKETVIVPVEEEVKIEEEVLEAVSSPIEEIVEQDPPLENVENKATMELELETMNGDPTVVTPVDEIQEEALAETFKENKINKRVDNMIGYSWNGMEMDTY